MPNAPQTGWAVEYQQETIGIGPDGKATEGVKVGFVSGLGNHGSVFIPRARYSTDNVKAELADAAAQMDAVHKLTG